MDHKCHFTTPSFSRLLQYGIQPPVIFLRWSHYPIWSPQYYRPFYHHHHHNWQIIPSDHSNLLFLSHLITPILSFILSSSPQLTNYPIWSPQYHPIIITPITPHLHHHNWPIASIHTLCIGGKRIIFFIFNYHLKGNFLPPPIMLESSIDWSQLELTVLRKMARNNFLWSLNAFYWNMPRISILRYSLLAIKLTCWRIRRQKRHRRNCDCWISKSLLLNFVVKNGLFCCLQQCWPFVLCDTHES